jgi:hypothetical protein
MEQFIQNNRWLIIFLISISFLSYGYALFNFNISIDAELIGVDKDQWYWLSIGRWGMYLINSTLMMHTTIPTVPLAIALLCLIISSIAIFRLFTINSEYSVYANYIFSALVVSFPIFPHMLMFSTSAAGIGIAVLSIAIGLYFYSSISKIHKIYAAAYFIFAIGIYQSFILLIFSIIIALSIHEFIRNNMSNNKDSLLIFNKQILGHIAFLILISLMYIGISKLIILIRGVKPLYADFIHYELIFNDAYSVLKNMINYFNAAYSGNKQIYTHNLPFIAIINGISLWSLLQLSIKYRKSILLLPLILIIWLWIPFVFNLLNNGHIALRTLLALPFTSVLWWWMGYNYGNNIIKQAILICSVVLMIQFAIINNYNFNSTGIALDQDKTIATNLIYDIDKVIYNIKDSNSLPCLEFIGYKTFAENEFFTKHEVFGASFFEWAHQTPEHVWRIYRFLRLMGLNVNLQICSADKSRSVIDVAHNLPSWPHDDAIKIVNDVLIVKLSN